jgi:uncharacterized protein (DUF1499 family)
MDQDSPLICETPKTRLGRIILLGGAGLSGIAIFMLLSAGIGSRFGLWHFRTGFALLKFAAYFGGAAALLICTGIFLSVGVSRKYMFQGIVALTIALTAVIVPSYWKVSAGSLPRIHDISTDTVTPPGFVALIPLRKDAANPPEYGGAEVAAKQHAAYPDIKPIVLGLSSLQAFDKALDAARNLNWEIVAAVPEEGRIEAIDTTFWFGFKDDVVIRITSAGERRSVVDIRSVSRVGVSDVGTNAARIRSFLARMVK